MTIQNILLQNKNYIIDKYNSGISTNKLAQEFNCNSGTLYYFLQNNNIQIKKRKNFQGNIEDYKDQILFMFDNGNSSYKIAKDLNISKPTILKILKNNKRNTSKKNKINKNNLLKDKSNLVLKLYNEGKTQQEIADIVGHGNSNICKLLHSLNIDVRDNTIYSVNEEYFNKIDSAEKAYILGWFYSDGNITKDKVRIQIQDIDKYILEWIAEKIEYTGPLHFVKRRKKHHHDQYCLAICRKKLVDSLIKLGCTPKKSLILKFPSYEIVPEQYFSSFLLGVWDGDGSISINKRGCLKICVTSSRNFIIGLGEYIENLDFPYTIYQKPTKKNTLQLSISGQKKSVEFLNWLYADAPFYLNRKHDKYLEFCKEEKF